MFAVVPVPKSKILAHWVVAAGLTQAAIVKSVSWAPTSWGQAHVAGIAWRAEPQRRAELSRDPVDRHGVRAATAADPGGDGRLARRQLGDHPVELCRKDLVAGGGVGLRQQGQEVPGPMAAEQAAVLPPAGRRDPGWVGPAGVLVEEDQEAALVVLPGEVEHPVLLLREDPTVQPYGGQGERPDRCGATGADVGREVLDQRQVIARRGGGGRGGRGG
jgi:hypothetical protein